jgi:hypothetical protein
MVLDRVHAKARRARRAFARDRLDPLGVDLVDIRAAARNATPPRPLRLCANQSFSDSVRERKSFPGETSGLRHRWAFGGRWIALSPPLPGADGDPFQIWDRAEARRARRRFACRGRGPLCSDRGLIADAARNAPSPRPSRLSVNPFLSFAATGAAQVSPGKLFSFGRALARQGRAGSRSSAHVLPPYVPRQVPGHGAAWGHVARNCARARRFPVSPSPAPRVSPGKLFRSAA